MNKKQNKIVSEHFRELAKKSWKVRLKKILDTKKVVASEKPSKK